MPNPWDIGSARILADLGFPALATTSHGHAASIGKRDQQVTRDELVAHAAALAAAVDVPLNLDAERCFADTPAGVAETVGLLAETGAAGLSIEDYDPVAGGGRAAGGGRRPGGGRCRGGPRRGHGADGPGREPPVRGGRPRRHHRPPAGLSGRGRRGRLRPALTDIADIARLVEAVAVPVNVLALPGAPSVPELAAVGVRRVSTGGALTQVAYGALREAARALLPSD